MRYIFCIRGLVTLQHIPYNSSYTSLQTKGESDKRMNNQFIGKPEYPPTPPFPNMPFPTQTMAMAMLQDALNHISSKNPALERYKVAQKVLQASQMVLMNQRVPSPSKDELKTTLDVLCEIKKENVMTQAQKDSIEAETEWYKLLLEWLMPD